VRALSVAVWLVAVPELLGQVLGQIADAAGGILGPGENALGVELGPKPGHMPGLVIIGDGVQCLIPGGQQLASGEVEVAAAGLIPHRQVIPLEPDLVGGRPPDLVVGGGDDLPQLGAGDGATHSDVRVGGQAPLGFDGGEVLHVVAKDTAQVLGEAVEQRGEVQRIPRRPLIVVAGRVGRGASSPTRP
jgi:hypothetical protein